VSHTANIGATSDHNHIIIWKSRT